MLAASGCTSEGPARSSDGSSPTISPVSASYAARQRARDELATAFAKRLAGEVPRLPGERVLTTTPSDLTQPGETIGAADLITETRYWVVSRPALEVFRAMKRAHSPYRLTGHGAPGQGPDPENEGFLSYSEPRLPAYIQGGEIHVRIVGRSRSRTIVASFAEVYTHPVRMSVEHIDGTSATGKYSWPRIALGKVVQHVTEPLGPKALSQLISGFNRSPVANGPNVCFGAFGLARAVVKVRIDSAGVVWELVFPGTSCVDLAVSRDGHELPALSPDPRLRGILGGLEHQGSSVRGRLILVGGPAGSVATAPSQPGTVTLRVEGLVVARARTYGAGRFSLSPQAGHYLLTATTPSYQIDGHQGRCSAAHPVTVRANHPVQVNIYCQRR